jgi:hypothetical protein
MGINRAGIVDRLWPSSPQQFRPTQGRSFRLSQNIEQTEFLGSQINKKTLILHSALN